MLTANVRIFDIVYVYLPQILWELNLTYNNTVYVAYVICYLCIYQNKTFIVLNIIWNKDLKNNRVSAHEHLKNNNLRCE